MSETSISKNEFGLFCVLRQLFHFIFFLLSHPLYFSYFIFFFPYFLKLLFFLSPLFFSTSLLLFAFSLFLSSTSDLHSVPQFSDNSKIGFLAATLHVVVHCFRPRTSHEIDDFRSVEVLEAYKIVFETCNFDGEDIEFNVPEVEVKVDFEESFVNFPRKMQVDRQESMENFPGKILEVDCEETVENFPGKIMEMEVDCEESVGYFPGKMKVDRDESMENFPGNILEIELDCEEFLDYFPGKILDMKINCEEYVEKPLVYDNVAEIENEEAKIVKKEEIRVSWKAIENEMKKLREESSISWSSPWSLSRNYNLLRSNGSMRKEKEWRRTLACKLFEDLQNSEGTEGMDSLWETYEKIETNKLKKINGGSKSKKKIEDEDEDREGKLCCLQALKFSSRKMNLGMGKPNLVKMSKAVKGFGLFRKRSLIR